VIGALVQQQNQNLLRFNKLLTEEETEKGEAEVCGSDSGY
jgi:hypothetical protein